MKFRLNILLLLLLNICFLVRMKAQCHQRCNDPNLDKYWHYRYRLTHYFLVQGMKQGCSLPAASRNANVDQGGKNGTMSWNEGAIPLAYYIATLSTEYRLLKNSGYQVGGADGALNQTIRELFYALHAVFRLDSMAYANSTYTKTPGITWPGRGLMARDDVPSDFINTDQHCDDLNINIGCPTEDNNPPYSYYTTCSGKVGQVGVPNSGIIEGAFSDWISASKKNQESDCSQDMYAEVLMSLAMVVREVDNMPVSFTDGSNTYSTYNSQQINLYSMAQDLGQAILGYMANHNWNLQDTGGNTGLLGGATYPTSLPFADAAGPFWAPSSVPGHIAPDFRDLWQVYESIMTPSLSGGYFYDYDNSLPWLCAIAALSNSPSGQITHPWWSFGLPIIVRDNSAMQTVRYFCTNQVNLHDLVYDSFESLYWADFYQSMGMVLNGQSVYNEALENGYDFCNLETALNNAPCDGTYGHNDIENADEGWGAERRFVDSYPNQYGQGGADKGNFNGLDYMLLFNFQNLISQQFVNQSVNVANVTVPTVTTNDIGGGGDIGSDYYEDVINNGLTYSAACAPISVTQLQELNPLLTINNGGSPYQIDPFGIVEGTSTQVTIGGNVTIAGSKEYSIDFTASGDLYSDIAAGAFLDAACTIDCSSNCSPAKFSFQPDPDNADNLKKRQVQNNSTSIVNKSNDSLLESIANYPNPFNSQTTINFSLAKDSPVTLYISDLYGRKIANIVSGYYSQGIHTAVLNAVNLAPGVYFGVLQTQTSKKVIKIEKVN